MTNTVCRDCNKKISSKKSKQITSAINPKNKEILFFCDDSCLANFCKKQPAVMREFYRVSDKKDDPMEQEIKILAREYGYLIRELKKDIAEGKKCDCQICPIALELMEKLKQGDYSIQIEKL